MNYDGEFRTHDAKRWMQWSPSSGVVLDGRSYDADCGDGAVVPVTVRLTDGAPTFLDQSGLPLSAPPTRLRLQ